MLIYIVHKYARSAQSQLLERLVTAFMNSKQQVLELVSWGQFHKSNLPASAIDASVLSHKSLSFANYRYRVHMFTQLSISLEQSNC